MYQPLNEQFMFQAQHDRTAGMQALRAAQRSAHGERRWWRKGVRRTR